MNAVPRPGIRKEIETALASNPVVAVLGPRQSGKTTMARGFVSEHSANYFDLEDFAALAVRENPLITLAAQPGTGGHR